MNAKIGTTVSSSWQSRLNKAISVFLNFSYFSNKKIGCFDLCTELRSKKTNLIQLPKLLMYTNSRLEISDLDISSLSSLFGSFFTPILHFAVSAFNPTHLLWHRASAEQEFHWICTLHPALYDISYLIRTAFTDQAQARISRSPASSVRCLRPRIWN